MAKVITFSRQFPSYHPKKGEPTYFVEKFYNSLYGKNNLMDYPKGLAIDESVNECKYHTIRAGHRFKEGEFFSPRVWSGVPYNSKQIILCPDVKINKLWDIERDSYGVFSVLGDDFYDSDLERLANNDGLTSDDLWHWISWPFSGQIICWSDKIEYL